MDSASYLQSLLGRTLCIHTTDKRMFVGTFKCTDMVRYSPVYLKKRLANISIKKKECNVILSTTYEYRFPSQAAVEAAASTQQQQPGSNFKLDMTSRLIGLVVVPGKHITKIELEENPHEVRMQPMGVV